MASGYIIRALGAITEGFAELVDALQGYGEANELDDLTELCTALRLGLQSSDENLAIWSRWMVLQTAARHLRAA